VAATQDSMQDDLVVARLLRVFRFRPTGELVWRQSIVSTFAVVAPGRLAALPGGAVAICATIYDRVVAGPFVVTPSGVDFFVAVIKGDGTFDWAKSFGNASQQNGYDVALDPGGNLVVAGNNFGQIDFGGGLLQSNGVYDAVLAKLTPGGGHVWSRSYGFTNSQTITYVAVDPAGGIALAGGMGPVDFGGGILNGGQFVAMLNADAGHCFSVAFTGSGTAQIRGLAVDAQGRVLVAGACSGSVNFGGQSSNLTSAIFLAAYHTGGLQWLRVWDVDAGLFGLEATMNGAVYATGLYDDALTIAPEETPPGSVLLIEFDEAGNAVSAPGFGEPGGTGFPTIGSDHSGRIAIVGLFHRPIDFGSGIHRPSAPLDLFVARFEPWQPLSVRVVAFDASVKSQAVELNWTVESDEELGSYRLRRRAGSDGELEIVTFGAASVGSHSFVDHGVRTNRAYTYDLVVTNRFGDEALSDPVSVRIPAATTTRIEQNVPNPFNPVTSIAYSLASPGRVTVVIYDVDGALVRRLDQGEQSAGHHTAYWSGYDAVGRPATSGVYFYRLEGAVTTPARRMVLLR
jgi:hypothetical protein